MIKNCVICGVEFKTNRVYKSPTTCGSDSCLKEHQRVKDAARYPEEKKHLTCPICNVTFKRNGPQKFCSKKCHKIYAASKRLNQHKVCKRCGINIKPGRVKTCSQHCTKMLNFKAKRKFLNKFRKWKNQSCVICNVQFSTSIKKYTCNWWCSKILSINLTKRSHLSRQSEVVFKKCNYCGIEFQSRAWNHNYHSRNCSLLDAIKHGRDNYTKNRNDILLQMRIKNRSAAARKQIFTIFTQGEQHGIRHPEAQ